MAIPPGYATHILGTNISSSGIVFTLESIFLGFRSNCNYAVSDIRK